MYIANGQATENKPTVNMSDFGFARGITVFELFRVYGGKPFYLEDHLDRLENGARILGITMPFTREKIKADIRNLIETHRFNHSAVKLYLTAGVPEKTSGLSFAANTGFNPQLFILEDEVKPQSVEAPYGAENYQRGQNLKTVPYIRELPAVKTANYGIGFYAATQVAGPAFDDVLFTTPQGHVTEATRSNFFAVINGILTTAETDMLQGITRTVVLKLAKELGIPTQIRNMTVAEVESASEAFTTGSVAELVPAGAINGKVMPSGTIQAPVFKALRQAFTQHVMAHPNVLK